MSNINNLLLEIFNSDLQQESIFGSNMANHLYSQSTLKTPAERLAAIKNNIKSGKSMYDAYKDSIKAHTDKLDRIGKQSDSMAHNMNYYNDKTKQEISKAYNNHISYQLFGGLPKRSMTVDPPSEASNQLKQKLLTQYSLDTPKPRGPVRLSDLKGL